MGIYKTMIHACMVDDDDVDSIYELSKEFSDDVSGLATIAWPGQEDPDRLFVMRTDEQRHARYQFWVDRLFPNVCTFDW